MPRSACLLALAVLLTCMAACSAASKENGAVLLRVADDPTVTFKVWFRVGSQHDPADRRGLAHLTGEMLASGSTTRNSYELILEKLYPLASSYDVRVDREMTVLTGRTHRDNLERFFELFTDAYLRPAFTEEDFQRVKTDTLNYLKNTLRYESDEELGKAALAAFVFEGTPYAHVPQGTVRGVESLTLDDVRAFYKKHYTREGAAVALGGGFGDDLVHRFGKTLEELPMGAGETAPIPAPPAIEGRQVLLVAKPDADASISLGFPIATLRGQREFYALWVANSWLGEHRNSASHLFQVIREARGLNYGDYSYIEAFPEGGRRQFPPAHVARRQQLFEIWVRTLPNARAHFALRAAMRELERLVERGMSPEDFELTRTFLKKYALHFADTTAARLGYAVDDRFYGIDGEGHLARFRRTMDELKLDEVNAALRKHLRPENLKIAIVTGDAEGLKQALAAEAPSPLTYDIQKNDQVKQEDEQIAVFPLKIVGARIRVIPVGEMFQE